jgi:drug/metabolite transporter (DMT)-like permease
MLIGSAMLGSVALVFESPLEVVWTRAAVLGVLYLALVGTVVSFGVYMWLLRYVPATRMSLTSFVIPVVALLLGAAVGGEPLGANTLLGTALVLGGVALASLRTRSG